MIKHLLVPLDGTSLAEAALPVTRYLARQLKARVTLLHVIEPDSRPLVHGEPHLTDRAAAEAYLGRLVAELTAAGIASDQHVHDESAPQIAGGIVEHEQELHPDLVVMCTHGPETLDRRLRGSLAQQVVARGRTPLLLVRPGTPAASEPFALQRLLVPLDGDPHHEQGFALACELARAGKAQLQLLSAVPRFGSLAGQRASLARYLPGATWMLQGVTVENLRGYLGGLLERAAEQGLTAGAEVCTGKPGPLITSAAENNDSDLIVLATHGKAGTEAFWANSVAAWVQARSARALLLVPVQPHG